ncbi:hypothetical protein UPYG_G00308500 [Umbra pygmaea]|uniref:Poly [ADP-ribose] polymerase n=1 Tax=Umbra pygmaea TaxID=75934 RepID=A0ABD0VZ50_UMBPY
MSMPESVVLDFYFALKIYSHILGIVTDNYCTVMMALFENLCVVLELKSLSYKEKTKLKLEITRNGGSISYVVNQQCSLIVTTSVSNLSSSRVRSVRKYQTPVVGVEYVSHCLEKGVLLPVDEYRLDPPSSTAPSLFTPRPASPSPSQSVLKVTSQPAAEQKSVQTLTQDERARNQKTTGTFLGKFRVYSDNDKDVPTYPTNFHVAKYCIFEKATCSTWSVLELQSSRGEGGQKYRVVRYWREGDGDQSAAVQDKQVFLSTSEEALEVYQALSRELQVKGLSLRTSLPPDALNLGSANLQQLLLEEKLSCSSLSQEVGVFVELLWAEALSCLDNILTVPFSSLSLNDVSRAEGLLLQVQKRLRQGAGSDTDVASLMEEVYTLLPHKSDVYRLPVQTKLISSQLDLCQLIRDVLNVSEAMLRSPSSSCLGKYRALRCSIERVPPGTEFLSVTSLLQDRPVQILQVLRVRRGVELQMFREELGNVKPLLHSSSASSFVGILSRGLLLPRVAVEHHGIERTDVGNLGGGIYFSDALKTSLKYSKPNETDGSRLLLVCDVALGRCKDLQKRDSSLTQAPDGYHSVHGLRSTSKTASEFEDDEYVVYNPEQVRLQYVVQYRLDSDQLKDFQPTIDTTALPLPVSPSDLLTGGEEDVGSCKNPLEEVTAGLLDSAGQPLPLQAIHIKTRLMDLLSKVVIFQTYTNQSTVPIEAKYVFPLDDSAAVCGFEAFINGKHVVGQVKEKQQARKEYKQAIEKGHGAYLMDQDAPDVFTISVGNLPAGATVLIKVTFVTELVVKDGMINFSLPGSVAPWQQSSALNQRTQVTLEKVCVTNLDSQGDFSLDMSIEMPNEIINLRCVTHKVKIKRTDCKAVVRTCPGETLGPDGFLLCFSLAQIHLPRMWVEKHPDRDSQACMLVFYPDFEPSSSSFSGSSEVILLLDSSESMRGEALQNARRIALQLLTTLKSYSVRVNVISFGTDQEEAFISAQPIVEALQPAKKFIVSSPPVGGSTELWRPLRSLSLLPPSQGMRNLLLLSDGHVQNQALTLQLVREHAQHSRLFTCGLSPTANRHMLRTLAQAGGGAYEFFDTKTKHTWSEKWACQVKRMMTPGCSSVSVKWQQFNPTAPPPVQAPSQLHALFSDCHTLVYGFVPHCTQATLLGDLNGQSVETMVSTTDLQKTRGTFLHQLTARAVIRDYEDGSLHMNEAEHEEKKAELKSFIIELSKDFSILSQFTSFVAIEERDSMQTDVGFTDVPKLISGEDVDFLPYLSWQEEEGLTASVAEEKDEEEEMAGLMGYAMNLSGIGLFPDNEEVLFEGRDMEKCLLQPAPPPAFRRRRRRDRRRQNLFNSSPSPPPTPLPPSTPFLSSHSRTTVAPYLSTRFIAQTPTDTSKLESFLESPVAFSLKCSQEKPSFSQSESSVMTFSSVQSCGLIRSSARPVVADRHLFATSSVSSETRDVGFSFSTGANAVSPSPVQTADFTYSQSGYPICSLRDNMRGSPKFGSDEAGGVLQQQKQQPLQPQQQHQEQLQDKIQLQSCKMSIPSLMSSQVPLAAGTLIPEGIQLPPHPAAYLKNKMMCSAPLAGLGAASLFRHSEVSSDSCLPSPQEMFTPRSVETGENKMKYKGSSGSSGGFPFEVSSDSCLPSPQEMFTPRSVETGENKMKYKGSSGSSGGFPFEVSSDSCLPSPQEMFTPRSVQYGEKKRKYRACSRRKSTSTLDLVKWTEIFALQHPEGYWECSSSLGSLIGLDLDYFANVFLEKKGISSLGMRARAVILKLVATLLVLQLIRVGRLEVGKMLLSLFRLDQSPPQPRCDHWEAVKRAVDWVCWADREYPCVSSRMEFGRDWESSTRQLLGIDPPLPPSPIILLGARMP